MTCRASRAAANESSSAASHSAANTTLSGGAHATREQSVAQHRFGFRIDEADENEDALLAVRLMLALRGRRHAQPAPRDLAHAHADAALLIHHAHEALRAQDRARQRLEPRAQARLLPYL